MVKIVKNPGHGRLNNLNDPVLNVLTFTINLIVPGTVKILQTITPLYICHTIFLNSFTRVSANKCLGTQFLG